MTAKQPKCFSIKNYSRTVSTEYTHDTNPSLRISVFIVRDWGTFVVWRSMIVFASKVQFWTCHAHDVRVYTTASRLIKHGEKDAVKVCADFPIDKPWFNREYSLHYLAIRFHAWLTSVPHTVPTQ